jgi:hypothetical protein
MALETPNAIVAAAVLRTASQDPGAPFEMLSSNGILELDNFSAADASACFCESAAALTLETPVTADEGVVLAWPGFLTLIPGGVTEAEYIAQIKNGPIGSAPYDALPNNTLFIGLAEGLLAQQRLSLAVLRLIRP